MKEILSLLGIYQFSGFKCEADDVIGTIAKKMAAKGRDVLVYSGDGDLRQLVGPRILIMSPGHKGKERIYGFEDVVNKDGVEPRQIPDLKALAGDSSDNIPGIRGVGKKTASTLVYTYGDVESILLAAKKSDDWPVSERFLEPILDDSENIRLYKQLATIKTDVKLLPISQKRDFKEFVKLLYRYRFMSFINKKKLGLFRRMAMYEICHENNI